MKSFLTAVFLLTSAFGLSALAQDFPYERSIVCGDLISRYPDLIPGKVIELKQKFCRENLILTPDGGHLYATLNIDTTIILCPVLVNSSRRGITAGECEVAESKPRMGVSN